MTKTLIIAGIILLILIGAVLWLTRMIKRAPMVEEKQPVWIKCTYVSPIMLFPERELPNNECMVALKVYRRGIGNNLLYINGQNNIKFHRGGRYIRIWDRKTEHYVIFHNYDTFELQINV